MTTFPETAVIMTALAALAAGWNQIKSAFDRIRSFVFVRSTCRGNLSDAIQSYCWTHLRPGLQGDREFMSWAMWVRPVRRILDIAFEWPAEQPMLFFDGWRPIWVAAVKQQNPDVVTSNDLVVTTIRGMVDPVELVTKCLEAFNTFTQSGSKRHRVQRVAIDVFGARSGASGRVGSNGPVASPPAVAERTLTPWRRWVHWKPEDIGAPIPPDPLRHVATTLEMREHMQEFSTWLSSREWYEKCGLAWRRGWLLYGKPGSGKTTFIRMLAQLHDLPIIVLDLATFDNYQMGHIWKSIQEQAPCIAVIEDIDAVFNGRENVTGEQGGGLTFDCLLNCLSGMETAEGVFVVATSNDKSKVDEALTRHGRLDRSIEFEPAGGAEMHHIAGRILQDWPELILPTVTNNSGMTFAQFTDVCACIALKKKWEDNQS